MLMLPPFGNHSLGLVFCITHNIGCLVLYYSLIMASNMSGAGCWRGQAYLLNTLKYVSPGQLEWRWVVIYVHCVNVALITIGRTFYLLHTPMFTTTEKKSYKTIRLKGNRTLFTLLPHELVSKFLAILFYK